MSEGCRRRRCLEVITAAAITLGSRAFGQTLGQAIEPPVSYWRVAAAFGVCVLLALGAALALRARMGARRMGLRSISSRSIADAFRAALSGWDKDDRPLKLIDTVRVSSQLEICVVGFGDEEFLIAASGHAVALIEKRQAPKTPVAGVSS